jgi:hypothetical protein
MHDDKPLLDEVETLNGDRWVVGNETRSVFPDEVGNKLSSLEAAILQARAIAGGNPPDKLAEFRRSFL